MEEDDGPGKFTPDEGALWQEFGMKGRFEFAACERNEADGESTEGKGANVRLDGDPAVL